MVKLLSIHKAGRAGGTRLSGSKKVTDEQIGKNMEKIGETFDKSIEAHKAVISLVEMLKKEG